MILDEEKIKNLNKYFKDFVLAHKDSFYQEEYERNTVENIQKNDDVPFHNNWNYLMIIVQIIEKKWHLEKIETHDNWVRFSLTDSDAFQDKGMTKIEAFYLCCFRILEHMWKEQQPPFDLENHEPFDEFDLK